MIEPKEIEVTTQKGETRKYIIAKFPAVQGREIVAKYPLSAMPKLGDYEVNEETMLKLIGFVGVPQATGEPLMLSTRALVDNHIPDWETLARIEIAMMEYNVSFFGNGQASIFFERIARKLQTLTSEMLTGLSAQLSKAGKPPSSS